MLQAEPINPDRYQALHALNEAHAVELSSFPFDDFGRRVLKTCYNQCIGDDAFILCYDQDADYDSANFQWFKSRFDRFVYVDRVVVSAASRGQGLARRLYEGTIAHCTAHASPRLVAEINSDPPNPGSDKFHAAMGFQTVGEARLDGVDKTVRYVALEF